MWLVAAVVVIAAALRGSHKAFAVSDLSGLGHHARRRRRVDGDDGGAHCRRQQDLSPSRKEPRSLVRAGAPFTPC
jgi:hypothetical protein